MMTMKQRAALGLLAVLVAFPLTTACAGGAGLGDPRTMTFAPVEFSPPEPERVVLDNGMVVYLLEDHELPLITLTATIRAGSWLDPADKIGLAALTGSVMRTGGGGGLSAEQVDEELEQFAGEISIGLGRQSGSASLDVLISHEASRFSPASSERRPSTRPVLSWPSYRPSKVSADARTIPGPSSVVNSSRCSMDPIIRPRARVRLIRCGASIGTI
jgi:hypothetical protein